MYDISLDNNIFVTDKLTAAIQELDLMFNTENTELIGYTNYGTNWQQFLWDLNPSTTVLKQYIENKFIETYFLRQYSPTVAVEYQQGTQRAIYNVKITLTDPNTGEQVDIQQYELK